MFSWRLYQFSASSLRFTMILIFSIFLMNFSRNNKNAAILKIIKKSRNCHSRFTANYSKFLERHSIHREMRYNFTPTILKIWKIWALCLLSWNEVWIECQNLVKFQRKTKHDPYSYTKRSQLRQEFPYDLGIRFKRVYRLFCNVSKKLFSLYASKCDRSFCLVSLHSHLM